MSDIHIGTSGWSYDDWRGVFYPEDIQKADMLSHYAKHYSSVEVNATFYRIPFQNMIKGWYNKVPSGFTYAVKGHRRITHYNKLQSIEDTLEQFIERIRELEEHLGPILWQLPPSFERDYNVLESFLDKLPGDLCHAVEFRHESWLENDVFELLKSHNIAQVWVSSGKMPANYTRTADFVYARFHGLSGGYDYDYSRNELKPWARQLNKVLNQNKDCYVYFNNDKDGMALKSIKILKDLLQNNGDA